jgi:hypothetical protein
MGFGMVGGVTALASTGVGAATLSSVVTGPPSAISVTGATLSGDVNPNGASTTYDFEYGTTADFGLDTAVVAAGAGVHDVGASAHLGGLTPGTTYYYRLVARNYLGKSYGSASSFHTPAHAPTIPSTWFTDVSDTSAVAVAVIDAEGLASTWSVHYGPSPALGLVSAAHAVGSSVSPVTVHIPLRHLAAHTSYYFEAVATNAVGSTPGSAVSFLTTGAPIVAAQSIRALTPTSVTLAGSVIPDGHVTRWYFQYGTTTAYGATTKVGDAGSSMDTVAVGRSVPGLAANTVYHFRLIAVSADGTVADGDSAFETPGPTLSSSFGTVNFGIASMLTGTVPSGAANEDVAVYGQEATSLSYVELATVLTGSGGSWSYLAQPRISTNYKVIWHNESSPVVSIGVSPAVTLREPAHGRFVSHVVAATSLRGRLVRLQRLEHGVWRTVAARPLNRGSSVTFQPSLPKGRSQLRVYVTAFQAGAGYLAGLSGVHAYRL